MLNAVQIVIAPIPGYVLQVAAGFLFGPFWGGVWGILFELIHNRFPRGGGYWLTAFLFGAILPTLVALLVVLPLKGRAIGGGWQPALLITAFLINGVGALGPLGS